MKQIKFNLYLPSWNFKKTREHALLAEEMGFYSVSFGDHFYMDVSQGGSVGQKPTTPNLECYTALAAVASITKKVKLVTAVTPIGFRNPAVLGKMIATLDHISEGRFIAGLGSGWQRTEYEAYGLPFLPTARACANSKTPSSCSRSCGPILNRPTTGRIFQSTRRTTSRSRRKSHIRQS